MGWSHTGLNRSVYIEMVSAQPLDIMSCNLEDQCVFYRLPPSIHGEHGDLSATQFQDEGGQNAEMW